jgi:hypothetical protein
VLLVLVLVPAAARAQDLPGRVAIAGGIRWIGSIALDGKDATETAAGGGRVTRFESDSRLEAAPMFEARVGVRLPASLQVEASGSFGTSDLTTRLTSDAEGVPDATIGERVTHWTIEGALVAHLASWRLGARTVPFLSAGAGYLKQQHEGRTVSETGVLYHAGGGLDIGLSDALGLRADVRAVIRSGGVAFDDSARVAPGAGASLFVVF